MRSLLKLVSPTTFIKAVVGLSRLVAALTIKAEAQQRYFDTAAEQARFFMENQREQQRAAKLEREAEATATAYRLELTLGRVVR